MENLKTFKDLVFKPHSDNGLTTGLRARILFDNGWGLSIVRFKSIVEDPFILIDKKLKGIINSKYDSYTNNENEWEIGILKKNQLCYKNPFHNDAVKGYLLENDVSELMIKIQEYKD